MAESTLAGKVLDSSWFWVLLGAGLYFSVKGLITTAVKNGVIAAWQERGIG